MEVRWLLVVVALTVPVAGCLDGVLDGSEERRTEGKVDLDETFHAEDTVDPDSPDTWARTRDVAFQVDAGETDLQVRIEVAFEEDNPIPGAPSGNVTVDLTDPRDATRNWTFQRSGAEQATIADPATGTWNLVVRAQGDGSFSVVVETSAPAG